MNKICIRCNNSDNQVLVNRRMCKQCELLTRREQYKHRYDTDEEFRQRKLSQARKDLEPKTLICIRCNDPNNPILHKRRVCQRCALLFRNEQYKHKYANDEEFRKRIADENRFYKYGVTPDVFMELSNTQDHKCAICHAHKSTCKLPGKNREAYGLVVDHDHITGKIRGLLCHTCNVMIGMIEQIPENGISKIQDYLARHSS